MLKRNSINIHCKFGAQQTWELAGRIGDFGNFLNGFAQSPQLIVLNIDWVQYLSWKIVKYCILCEVCVINSTVSPQMWCIKSIKGWFTASDLLARFCKVNLSKAKLWPDLFSKSLFSRSNLLWSRAIMALECDRRWLLFFGCSLWLSTRCKMFHSKIT